MSKPDHVRCQTCCYWKQMDIHRPDLIKPAEFLGRCIRGLHVGDEEAVWSHDPRIASFKWPWRASEDGCGEWRSEWPGDRERRAKEAFDRGRAMEALKILTEDPNQ